MSDWRCATTLIVEWRLAIDRKRSVIDDLQTIPWQVGQPRRFIGEQDHFPNANIAQNLRTYTVIAEIGFGGIEVSARAYNRASLARVDIARDRLRLPLEVQNHAFA